MTCAVVLALNRDEDRCSSRHSTAAPRVVPLGRRFRAKDPTARLLGLPTASMNAEVRVHTQPSILPGSVNEYQLRLGRKRQVWFILLADERGVSR